MRTAIIDINDYQVRVGDRQGNTVFQSPAVALLEEGRGNKAALLLGDAAAAQARTRPMQINSRFWLDFDTRPADHPHPLVRHNADIAHQHLLHLHEHSGRPEQVLFALPGNWNEEQLALFLGLCQHCPFEVLAVVNRHLLHFSLVKRAGTHLLVDVQRHQTNAVLVDVDADQSLREVISWPDVSLSRCFDLCARQVAKIFIDLTRFDPLHSAAHEQLIHNQLEDWFRQFQQQDLLHINIDGREAKLQKQSLYSALLPQFETLQQRLQELQKRVSFDQLLTSANADLGNLLRSLNGDMLAEDCVVRSAAQHWSELCAHGPETFVTRMSGGGQLEPKPSSTGGRQATHVLQKHRARPLNGLPLFWEGDVFTDAVTDRSLLSLAREKEQLQLIPASEANILLNGSEVRQVTPLYCGDTLSQSGSDASFTLIEVVAGDGP